MTRLGVGFIGAGPATQAIHLPTLARMPDVFEVVSVMDVDPEIAGAVADRCGASAVTDVDAVLGDDRVDVVAICSPHRFHAEQVEAAISAGKKAILCEKPFALTRAEASRIAELAASSGTPIVVGAMHTFDPAWTAAIAQFGGAAERVGLVRSTIVLPLNDRYEDWATQILARAAPPPVSVDAFENRVNMVVAGVLGLAIHNLPLVRHFVPTVERVDAATALLPFGYSVTAGGENRLVELVGRMDRRWRPDWSLEAIGPDVRVRAVFPPSYVQAGSSTVTVRTGDSVRTFGPFDANGYEVEWAHLAELARGAAAPRQSHDGVIDDLTYGIGIAESAERRLRRRGAPDA
jgi:myo-inositol 2-dehydrogenase/D-chiro-inositol 1-dehydrogenase